MLTFRSSGYHTGKTITLATILVALVGIAAGVLVERRARG